MTYPQSRQACCVERILIRQETNCCGTLAGNSLAVWCGISAFGWLVSLRAGLSSCSHRVAAEGLVEVLVGVAISVGWLVSLPP